MSKLYILAGAFAVFLPLRRWCCRDAYQDTGYEFRENSA